MTVARVGVLVRDGYQELEFWYPLLRLREEGADVTVIGAGDRTYHSRLGYPVIPDITLASASDQLDAIVVPGASARDAVDADTRQFLKRAHARGAIVAATSEGPRALAEAGILQGAKSINRRRGRGRLRSSRRVPPTTCRLFFARSTPLFSERFSNGEDPYRSRRHLAR